ncbi:hypothetical protein BHE74_00016433 [Ensete ventricosum]|nr:hypothetical protein BHE74_00016433 [Ensete ventricosum]RZR93720.1 hypothetical protein BHM03_00022274 [Ensete ventricosum]
MIGATRELDYFSAYIRLRELSKSEDKVEGGSTDCEERDADVRQQIVGPWAGNATVPQRQDFHGVIDPLLSWWESVDHKKGRGGGEYRGKLQVSRQAERAEAKESHKTGVDELLIKIAKNEGFRVDVGGLDQGMK